MLLLLCLRIQLRIDDDYGPWSENQGAHLLQGNTRVWVQTQAAVPKVLTVSEEDRQTAKLRGIQNVLRRKEASVPTARVSKGSFRWNLEVNTENQVPVGGGGLLHVFPGGKPPEGYSKRYLGGKKELGFQSKLGEKLCRVAELLHTPAAA